MKTTIEQTTRGWVVRVNGSLWGTYQTQQQATEMAASLEKADIGG